MKQTHNTNTLLFKSIKIQTKKKHFSIRLRNIIIIYILIVTERLNLPLTLCWTHQHTHSHTYMNCVCVHPCYSLSYICFQFYLFPPTYFKSFSFLFTQKLKLIESGKQIFFVLLMFTVNILDSYYCYDTSTIETSVGESSEHVRILVIR